MSTARLTMAISGLSCGGGGALVVERALAKLPGVVRVYVNPATEMAYIEYDPSRLSWEQLAAAVESVGFRASEPMVR
ncbi:hypothetical protein HRbin28_01243 [bacterium HR28]|nr:hypothetical protein HRbin28_01243 [bacterium HR28]